MHACGATWNGFSWDGPDTSLQLVKVSQEHGIVEYASTGKIKYKPGDLLYLIPAHSCLAANLLRNAFTMEGDKLDLFRE